METRAYITQRLTGLHYAGAEVNFREKFIVFLISLAVIFLIPFFHLGVCYYIWAPDKPTINRGQCTCECFDTVFRGRYEWPPSNYKHIYFNSTRSTLGIWFILLLGVLGFYESLRYILPLVWHRTIRIPMLILFLTSIYPHYYGWWGLFNYVNEGFYYQWWHQIFFSVTELLSTAMVLHLSNTQNKAETWKLLFIISINTMHIIVNSLDQFIVNIIYGRGQVFEALRDFGLMIPDLFHVLLSYFELSILAESRGVSVIRLFYREELMLSVVIISLLSFFGKNL